MENLICKTVDKGGDQEAAASDKQTGTPEIVPFAQGKKLTKDKKEYTQKQDERWNPLFNGDVQVDVMGVIRFVMDSCGCM